MLKPVQRGGIYLPSLNLWMDSRRPKPFAVISHAHSDHVARHPSFVATPETLDLIRVRHGAPQAQLGAGLPLW